MRARSFVPLALCLASALAAYACSDGTFDNTLPLYDPDAGPQPSEDSGAPSEDAAEDVTFADVITSDAGEAETTDAGDAETKDAGDAEAIDAGDAGDGSAPLDAGDHAG
jgi:hypothetical protein